MSLINPTPPPVVTNNPLTPEQIYANCVLSYNQQMQSAYNAVVEISTILANFIYNNQMVMSDNSTPDAQYYFNQIGTNGVSLCQISAATTALIAACGGATMPLPPDGVNLTYNADGSVTVTYTAKKN